MIAIQNTDAINAIRDGARLSISEGFPQQLIRSVQPVMDMTPRFHRLMKATGGVYSGSGSSSVITGQTRKINIHTIQLSMIKNSTCDVTQVDVRATIGGVVKVLASIALLASTAQDKDIIINYPIPLRIDDGTAVVVSGTFTTGNMNRVCIISYSEFD